MNDLENSSDEAISSSSSDSSDSESESSGDIFEEIHSTKAEDGEESQLSMSKMDLKDKEGLHPVCLEFDNISYDIHIHSYSFIHV